MQYESICKSICCSSADTTEARPIDCGHDHSGLVPNGLGRAPILIGCDWRHIENAMAECTKGYRGMSCIGFIRERDFENANVANDRRRDGRDKKEERGNEYKGNAYIVKASKHDWY